MKILGGVAVCVAALIAGVLLLPILAFAALLGSAAWTTRAVARKLRFAPPSARWQDFVQYEPVIGWRPRPDLDLYAQADEVFPLTTGPDGWRGRVPIEEAELVVFGDSFAFGHGTPEEKMYTQWCGELLVKPIGSDGYDMVQGLLWMEQLAPQLAGKLVVWFVYYGNDLWDNLQPNTHRYRKPFVRHLDPHSGWEIVTDHVSPEPWPFESHRSDNARLAEICSHSPLKERVFSACDYLVRRADSVCKDIDAQLCVVGIPVRSQLTRRGQAQLARLAPDGHRVDPYLPDKMLQETCHRLGVAFVPLSAHLSPRDYLLQDIHWQLSGHKRVGRLLRDLHGQTTS